MKPDALVKRLYEMGLKPLAFFPPGSLGIPVVSIGLMDTVHIGPVELPAGWQLRSDPGGYRIYYWPDAPWEREFGKERSNA